MSEKIQVTQQDIDTGKRRNSANCAIALALKREFAYDMNVLGLVGSLIRIGKDHYQATPEVVRWIANFDKGRAVKPITLELETVSYFESKTYERKGRQPIPICGEARVADS